MCHLPFVFITSSWPSSSSSNAPPNPARVARRMTTTTTCSTATGNRAHHVSSAFCVYYFFLAVVLIRYETTATACWALLFIVRAFFNDTITVAVWTGFHVRLLEMVPCFANPAVKEKARPDARPNPHASRRC